MSLPRSSGNDFTMVRFSSRHSPIPEEDYSSDESITYVFMNPATPSSPTNPSAILRHRSDDPPPKVRSLEQESITSRNRGHEKQRTPKSPKSFGSIQRDLKVEGISLSLDSNRWEIISRASPA